MSPSYDGPESSRIRRRSLNIVASACRTLSGLMSASSNPLTKAASMDLPPNISGPRSGSLLPLRKI
ncbi:MAG: hypothetical protein LBD01_03165 [Puniceicoccales bacterium]|nr:hypothetical protein [Puniceicoccales bacterium]